jgi:hypothetical protein
MASKADNQQHQEAQTESNSSDSLNSQESYTANPNQKVYDMPHVVDHLVMVWDIYFAEKKKKYKLVSKEEVYKVRNGGKIADIRKSYEDKFKKEKKTVQNLATDPNHANDLKPGDQIKLTWKEREDDGFGMKKISKAKIRR